MNDQLQPEAPEPAPRQWNFGVGNALAIGVLVFVLGLAGLVFWGIRNVADSIPTPGDVADALAPEPFEEVGPVIVSSVRDLANLTTVEVVQYTIVKKGTDGGFLAWARGDSVELFAVARIGAGVDLGNISVRSFDVSTDGVVEIVVPSATVQYVAVDSDATQILDRSTGLFTKGDPRLETDARRLAEEVLVQRALDEGLLTKAEDNARSVLTDFFLSLGYHDVIIDFKEPS